MIESCKKAFKEAGLDEDNLHFYSFDYSSGTGANRITLNQNRSRQLSNWATRKSSRWMVDYFCELTKYQLFSPVDSSP